MYHKKKKASKSIIIVILYFQNLGLKIQAWGFFKQNAWLPILNTDSFHFQMDL